MMQNYYNNGELKLVGSINSELEQAKEQYHNWKKILSGALNDKQLLCGLGVLFGFYLFYSVFNTIIGNDQDEDNLTCQCPSSHRQFYQAVVITSGLIWIACFASITIYDSHIFIIMYRNHIRSRNSKVPGHTADSLKQTDSTDDNQQPTEKNQVKSKYGELDNALKLCEQQLWLEFYKAYSVGSGTYENTKLPSIKTIVKKFTKDVDNTGTRRVHDETMDCNKGDDEIDSGRKKSQSDDESDDVEKIARSTFFFFYPFLVIVRLLAQVIAVPILILQMLNTYAWICVTGDYHCQNAVTRYQLGLFQAYITFGFYIALLIAILNTTMLRWFPLSKKARDAGATSYA